MIKRSHIRQFLALVEAESFTLAAARIHVTQPTLSAGIADLERLIDAKLFVRSKRRVSLTDEGRRFLSTAREIEQNFKTAERFGRRSAQGWPDLRIGMLKTLSGAMVGQIVSHLSAHFSLEITEGSDAELRSMRSKGHLDVILTTKRESDKTVDALDLLSEPYRMFVPDGHRLACAPQVIPEELAGETMIARRNCEILRDTSRFFTRHGVRPNFAMKSENDDWCMRAVSARLGVTTAPLSLQIAGTRPIDVKGYEFSRTISMMFASAHAGTAARDRLEWLLSDLFRRPSRRDGVS